MNCGHGMRPGVGRRSRARVCPTATCSRPSSRPRRRAPGSGSGSCGAWPSRPAATSPPSTATAPGRCSRCALPIADRGPARRPSGARRRRRRAPDERRGRRAARRRVHRRHRGSRRRRRRRRTASRRFDCAVLDYRLPGIDGVEAADRLPGLPVIVISSDETAAAALAASGKEQCLVHGEAVPHGRPARRPVPVSWQRRS